MDEGCIFCDIVRELAPANVIYRDADACSFLDIDPVADGHALAVARQHVSDIVAEGAADALAGMAKALVTFPPNPEARENLDRTHRRLTRDL